MKSSSSKVTSFLLKCIPFFIVIIVGVFLILFLGGSIKAKQKAIKEKRVREINIEKPLTNVVTMELIPGIVKEKITLPGVAKPWISLTIVSEIRGKIVNKKALEGQLVKKGDVLAVIDKSDYQNSYDSALASYETALSTKKRLTALSKQKFVTQSQLDDAIARVKTSKAVMDNAKLNLSRCTIRSPMHGTVDKVYIENGMFLASGDPVLKILQIERVKIEVGIPESDVDAVRKLKTFNMTIDALEKKEFQGSHYYLSKTTDDMAKLYNLQIAVNNPDGQILPDMFARVKIVKKEVLNGLAVPIYSLVTQGELTGVFIENDRMAAFRPVETGIQEGWKIEITKGLNPGDQVVVVGHRIIEDGEQVNVIKTIKDMEELSR